MQPIKYDWLGVIYETDQHAKYAYRNKDITSDELQSQLLDG